MWPNAVGTFNRPLASIYRYTNSFFVFKRIHRNVDKKNILKNLKTLEKNHDLGDTLDLFHYKTKNEN